MRKAWLQPRLFYVFTRRARRGKNAEVCLKVQCNMEKKTLNINIKYKYKKDALPWTTTAEHPDDSLLNNVDSFFEYYNHSTKSIILIPKLTFGDLII